MEEWVGKDCGASSKLIWWGFHSTLIFQSLPTRVTHYSMFGSSQKKLSSWFSPSESYLFSASLFAFGGSSEIEEACRRKCWFWWCSLLKDEEPSLFWLMSKKRKGKKKVGLTWSFSLWQGHTLASFDSLEGLWRSNSWEAVFTCLITIEMETSYSTSGSLQRGKECSLDWNIFLTCLIKARTKQNAWEKGSWCPM